MESQALTGIDDGLPMNEDVGSWSEDKYALFTAYARMLTTSMKDSWDELVYLDLFAGAGLSRVKGSKAILLGSPLLALSLPFRFKRYVFCERDSEKLEALEKRVRAGWPEADVRFVLGDCND